MERIYKLYVGLNDKDTKTQKIETMECYKVVENTLLNNGISGYTIYNGLGLYKHENGITTRENTLIIELMFVDNELVDKVINILKVALNQESILKQVQMIETTFC